MKQARLFPKGPSDLESDGDSLPPPPESRDQLRSRRRFGTRAQTVSVRRLPLYELRIERAQLELLEQVDPIGDIQRPKTRGECVDGQRPCPFVSCKHHLYLDVSTKTGAIKLNRPDLEPEQLEESCALDVADRGGETLENVGAIMNLTRERVRQIEVKALAMIEADPKTQQLRELYGLPDGAKTKRHLPVLHDQELAGDFDAQTFASSALDE